MEEGSGPQLPDSSGSANEGAAAVLTPLTVTLTGVLFQRPSLVHANADPTADDVEFSDLLQLFHDDTPSFMRNCLGWPYLRADFGGRSTWTLSLVKQESMPEERSSTCRTDDNVLFDASFEVPSELQSDIHVLYEILDLPARHIHLEPGEIEKPLVQRAVWRHVSTLGLPCSDSALRHVRHLLASAFSASSPLRRLLLIQEPGTICNSIINVPFTNVDGMFLADVAPATLGEQIASRCASLSYLALPDCSGSFINSLVETLSNQDCNIKQLLLPNVSKENESIIRSLGHILQDPRCSLSRLHIGAADEENLLRPLLEGGLDRNTSLTDLGLDMADVTQFDEFIGSGLHTRIRTLRLRFAVGRWEKRLEDLCRMLVVECLEDPNCTIQLLDLSWRYFESSSDIFLRMLIDSQSKPAVRHPAALKALRINYYFNFPGSIPTPVITGLAQYFRSPAASNLIYFEIDSFLEASSVYSLDVEQAEWELANSLINTFSICTFAFPWRHAAPRAHAASLMRRNQLYRAGQLFKEPQVKPNVAKLFLCGHPEVGKTTLCQALQKVKLAYPDWADCSWLAMGTIAAACGLNSGPSRTRGIEFHPLSFKDTERVLVCDLAGQEEYHVFHHYFINASSNDLFIVVCKMDMNSTTPTLFEQQLDYWLRFIVSHRSTRNRSFTTSASGGSTRVEIRPKVIVVVNFFNAYRNLDATSGITDGWASNVMEKFSNVLDFAVDDDRFKNLFSVNARKTFGVHPLKVRLRILLRDAINAAWPIPKLCYDISAQLIQRTPHLQCWLCPDIFASRQSESRLLTSYSTVLELIRADGSHANIESIKVQAALQELHNQGFVIFFPPEEMVEASSESPSAIEVNPVAKDNFQKKEDLSRTLVVTDISWFCSKLIGSLLGTHLIGEPRPACPWVWDKKEIKLMLLKHGCQQEHLEEILRYLQDLELCVSLDSVPGHAKGHVLFPALVKDQKVIQYPGICNVCDHAMSTTFLGRRLRCRDSSIHLIPFAVFTRLQVKLHKKYGADNMSFRLGYGWVSFMRGNVGAVVRFGGDLNTAEAWESKQLIDILIIFPDGCRHDNTMVSCSSSSVTTGSCAEYCGHRNKRLDDPSLLAGNKLISEIRTLVHGTCNAGQFGGIPTVMLEEWALQSKEPSSQAVPLATVLAKATIHGLQHSYQEWVLPVHPTPLVDLLLPKEIEDLVKGRFKVLEDIEEEFSIISNHQAVAEDGDNLQDELVAGKKLLLPSPLQELYEGITFQVKSSEERLKRKLERVNSILQLIREDISRLGVVLRETEHNIVANCSTRLLRHELQEDKAWPMYPYLVDVRAGKLAAIKALIGKRAVVHFMCESPRGGPHPVQGQRGKEVTVEVREWVAKAARVLVPAVRVLCCLARLAASVYLPSAQVFIPTPESLVSGLGIEKEALQHVILPRALLTLLDSLPDVDPRLFLSNTPGNSNMLIQQAKEVKEVMQLLLRNVQLDMASDFGLRRVYFDGLHDHTARSFWVCDDHVGNGKRLQSLPNPFQQ